MRDGKHGERDRRKVRGETWALLALALARPTPAHAAEGVCKDNSLRVEEVRRGDTVRLRAVPAGLSEAAVSLELSLENMDSSVAAPLTVDIEGQEPIDLVRLWPKDPRRAWRYRWNYWWRAGRRGATHDDSQVYHLPYAGVRLQALQGPGGSFSHTPGAAGENAVDFRMPEGTTIRAARAGRVVAVRDDSDQGGASRDYEECANYVALRHQDGSYARYVHLQLGGSLVRLGQEVEAGEALALAGATGFSTEPHLHFEVYEVLDGRRTRSIPIRFLTPSGEVVWPREGDLY